MGIFYSHELLLGAACSFSDSLNGLTLKRREFGYDVDLWLLYTCVGCRLSFKDELLPRSH